MADLSPSVLESSQLTDSLGRVRETSAVTDTPSPSRSEASAVSTSVSLTFPAATGLLSSVVSDVKGKVWWEAQQGTPVLAGQQSLTWDLRDRDGVPAPPGVYTLTYLQSHGFRSKLLAVPGVNYTPVWKKAVGNHNGVGVGIPYMLPGGPPGGPSQVFLYAGQVENSLIGAGITTGGAYTYMASPNVAPDGNGGFGGGFSAYKYNRGVLYLITRVRTVVRMPVGPGDNPSWVDPDVGPVNLPGWDGKDNHFTDQDLAVGGMSSAPVVVAAFNDLGRVVVLDKDALTPIPRKTWTVSAPRGVSSPDPTGAFCYVIQDNNILNLNLSTGVTTTFLSGLDTPMRLDLDQGTSDVYVACWGSRQQIMRYNSAGVLQQIYGRRGGRLDGVYDNKDFFNVISIKCDGKGGFCVTELFRPPRTCRYFDKDQKLLLEYFGGQNFGSSACPYPGDPTRCFVTSNFGVLLCHIDLTSGVTSVLESYFLSLTATPPFSNPNQLRATSFGGKVYLWDFGTNFKQEPLVGARVYCYDPVGKTFKGVAYCTGDGRPNLYIISDTGGNGFANGSTTYTYPSSNPQLNTGGKPSAIEVTPDFAYLTIPNFPGSPTVPITGVTGANFAPTFGTSSQTVPSVVPSVVSNGKTYTTASFLCRDEATGKLYGLFALEIQGAGNQDPQGYGNFFSQAVVGMVRLVCFSTDRTSVVWQVGAHATSWEKTPGMASNPTYLAGVARGCVFMLDSSDSSWPRCLVYDASSGAYLGDCLNSRPYDGYPWDASIYGTGNDDFGGTVLTDPTDRDAVLLYTSGFYSGRVYRIKGFSQITRASKPFTVSASPVALQAGTGLTVTYYHAPDLSGPVATSRTGPPWERIDGSLPHGISSDPFSATWSGAIIPPRTGAYRFSCLPRKQDGNSVGAQLWIGGQLVIDHNTCLGTEQGEQGGFWRSAPVSLVANTPVSVLGKMTNVATTSGPGFQGFGNDATRFLAVAWEPPGIAEKEHPLKTLTLRTEGGSLSASALNAWPALPDFAPPTLLRGSWSCQQFDGFEISHDYDPNRPLFVCGGISVADIDNPASGRCVQLGPGAFNSMCQIFAELPLGFFGQNGTDPSFTFSYDFKPVTFTGGDFLLFLQGNTTFLHNNFKKDLVRLSFGGINTNIANVGQIPCEWTLGGWNHFQVSYGPIDGIKIWVKNVLVFAHRPSLLQYPLKFVQFGPMETDNVVKIANVRLVGSETGQHQSEGRAEEVEQQGHSGRG